MGWEGAGGGGEPGGACPHGAGARMNTRMKGRAWGGEDTSFFSTLNAEPFRCTQKLRALLIALVVGSLKAATVCC